jgi:imidazolonepropionase-like amidohydrolase
VGRSQRRWDERVYDVQVRVDDGMAAVWAPYTFYVDGALRHCGVDSIELLRVGAEWRITQLADTRRMQGCRDVPPATSPVQQTPLQPRPGDIVLLDGRLFDATSEQSRANPGILVRNGVLLRVGLDGVGPLDQATVIRLDADHTVLPGLFDLHAHYAIDLFGAGRVDEYEVNPVVFLANGVTSTFPAGEVDPDGMRRAREEIDAGARPGPRIYNSGPYFGTARPGWRSEAMTSDSIRAEVDLWAARGARGFKAKGIGPEQLDVLIDQAHRHGLTVTGHLDSGFRGSVNPADAIQMGIDRVEHFMGGEAIRRDRGAYSSLEALDLNDPATASAVAATIRLYKERGVYFDATLTAYGYFAPEVDPGVYLRGPVEMDLLTPYARKVVEGQLPRASNQQFARIYKAKRGELAAFVAQGAGGLLTLGTDHPSWGQFFSGFGSHRELQAWVEAGVPAGVALRAATLNGARALGVSDRLGTIEAGKYADLFVVRGDPLTDIRVTRDVALVMKAGRTYDPARLLESVRGRLGPASESSADWWKGSVRFGG